MEHPTVVFNGSYIRNVRFYIIKKGNKIKLNLLAIQNKSKTTHIQEVARGKVSGGMKTVSDTSIRKRKYQMGCQLYAPLVSWMVY